MFDRGAGPPVIVVQALQGRWQWMRRFLDSLSKRCRVITYTLCGDFGAELCSDGAQGFDQYVRQLENVIDHARLERFALCGISFGGTVAVRYAARNPGRVTHLVIQSAPGPGWRAAPEQIPYLSRPVLMLPHFLWNALGRVRAELKAGLPHLMAKRVRMMETVDLAADAARISAPTLILTGEPGLDRVVPVESTKQYLAYVPNSRYEMIDNAGHTVSLIQPERLARVISEFINASRA